jgi:G:T-mismatch repair DNA endonuclease (very short patch repair protein)
VHGCFWHGHDGCPFAVVPTTRREFWLAKIGRNRERDTEAAARLRALGWRALVVWECDTIDRTKMLTRLRTFLGPPGRSSHRLKGIPSPR